MSRHLFDPTRIKPSRRQRDFATSIHELVYDGMSDIDFEDMLESSVLVKEYLDQNAKTFYAATQIKRKLDAAVREFEYE